MDSGLEGSIAPEFIAYTLYAFEINVRAATVLGLVGAGGVGVLVYGVLASLAQVPEVTDLLAQLRGRLPRLGRR